MPRLYISESSGIYGLMVYIREGQQNMVKLLKQEVPISLHFKKNTRGQTGGLQRHNERETRSATFKQISRPGWTDNILWKPKDDRTYGERVDDRLEAGLQGS